MESAGMNRGRAIRALAVVVLLLGLTGSALLARSGSATPDPAEEDPLAEPLAPEDYKSYARDMESFGGKIWIVVEKGRRWLVGMGRGNGPAVLLALASLAASGMLWRLAGRQDAPGGRPDARDKEVPPGQGPGRP